MSETSPMAVSTCQGEKHEIEVFLQSIQHEMHPYIKSIATEIESTGEPRLVGFSIRH